MSATLVSITTNGVRALINPAHVAAIGPLMHPQTMTRVIGMSAVVVVGHGTIPVPGPVDEWAKHLGCAVQEGPEIDDKGKAKPKQAEGPRLLR